MTTIMYLALATAAAVIVAVVAYLTYVAVSGKRSGESTSWRGSSGSADSSVWVLSSISHSYGNDCYISDSSGGDSSSFDSGGCDAGGGASSCD